MGEEGTIGRAVNELASQFAEARLETPRLDARILVAHVTGLEPALLFARSEDRLNSSEVEAIRALGARRLLREPVSRIIGHREFWGLSFELNAATLDPRPDTETVVSAALEFKSQYPGAARILDLGTGSGCILIAILSEWQDASGIGVDFAKDAVAQARANASRLGISARADFREGRWSEGLDEHFDLIVSNPPYIARADADTLAQDVVGYDPPLALFGGGDGLDAYRALVPGAKTRLKSGGRLILEIGAGQQQAVERLLQEAGFEVESRLPDLSGTVRALVSAPVLASVSDRQK